MGAISMLFNEALNALDLELRSIGGWLLRMHGAMVSVLSSIHARFPFAELHSHMETGHALSFARDKVVKRWCEAHSVVWREAPNSDIFRPHPSREGWSCRWHDRAIDRLYQRRPRSRHPKVPCFQMPF